MINGVGFLGEQMFLPAVAVGEGSGQLRQRGVHGAMRGLQMLISSISPASTAAMANSISAQVVRNSKYFSRCVSVSCLEAFKPAVRRATGKPENKALPLWSQVKPAK